MTKINLNEGKKYDATQVSTEGITQEELEEANKKAQKLIDIYKGDGKDLSQLDLALAMDGFTKAAGEDGKLSRKEMKAYAEALNKKHGLEGDDAIGVKDLKSFLKFVKNATQKDVKTDTQTVIEQDKLDKAKQDKAKNLADLTQKAKESGWEDAYGNENEKAYLDKNTGKIYRINADATDFEEVHWLDSEQRFLSMDEIKEEGLVEEFNNQVTQQKAEQEKAIADATAREAAEAEKRRLATPTEYTVQRGETIKGLLTRSLEAQGIEVNDETLAQAKAELIKNNPNAIHLVNGNESLYMGDVIKIAGGLENKGNAEQIKAEYRAEQTKKREKQAVQPEADRKSTAAQAETDSKAEAKRQAQRNAVLKKGYKTTENPDIFRDKYGAYYRLDPFGGLFKVDGIPVSRSGDTETIKTVDYSGRQKFITKNKNGGVESMQLRNVKNQMYTNPEYVARGLGLIETQHQGTYYDSSTKTHMVWDAKTNSFKALKGVKSVAANGMQFDQAGNSISPKGYRLLRNGSVKKQLDLSKANEHLAQSIKRNPNAKKVSAEVTYTFYPSGRVKTITVVDKTAGGYEGTTTIQYKDKPAESNGNRHYSRANGNFLGNNSILRLYGIDMYHPDKLV